MKPYYADATVTVHHGDCLDVLREMADASVDAVVTDPPAGVHFMSKSWDHNRGGRTQWVKWMTEVMTECCRVLKPGGHAFVWALPRTSHWTAWAIEDGGLVIRDCVVHLFGSGFPKSSRVDRDVRFCHCAASARTSSRTSPEQQPGDHTHMEDVVGAAGGVRRSAQSGSHATPSSPAGCHGEHGSGDAPPRPATTDGLAPVPSPGGAPTHSRSAALVDDPGDESARTPSPAQRSDPPSSPGYSTPSADPASPDGDTSSSRTPGLQTGWDTGSPTLHTPDTDGPLSAWPHCLTCGKPDANSWGTALKPASEHWWLARKPLAGTVAGNVQAWGTGALNIDGCRIEGPPSVGGSRRGTYLGLMNDDGWQPKPGEIDRQLAAGRWPANVVLDEDSAAELDRQSGEAPASYRPARTGQGGMGDGIGKTRENDGQPFGFGDTGGASRYFYTAKASSDERPFVWRLPCNCETIKPCEGTSQSRDTDGSRSAADKSWSTSTSGNSTTDDPSQTGTTSTTSTTTSSTTTPLTSSSSPSSPTSAFIPAASFEAANGGSPAPSVGNSSPSPSAIGTSALRVGRSTVAAAPVTSRGLSSTSVCERCGAPTRREAHATVKPLSLMRWLVRLVTPPGGTVLDPFAGSGTTAEAAILEGFRCIAIEREAEYLPLITQRINRRRDPVAYVRAAGSNGPASLFDLDGGAA